MYRRALQTLFVAATLLLTTTACDKGGDTKAAAKTEDKKAPAEGGDKVDAGATDAGAAEAGKVEEPKPEPTTAAEAGEPPTAEGGEVAAPGETGGAAPTEAGAEAGEKDGGEKDGGDKDGGEKDGGEKDGGDVKEPPPKDGGDASASKIDAKGLFEGKCKSCHGADGKGDTTIGKKVNIPSLAGTSLSKAKIVSIVEDGVPDTKMKGYKDKLSKEEIEAVAAYVKKL